MLPLIQKKKKNKQMLPAEQRVMLDATPHHMVHCRCNHMVQSLM